MKNAPVNIDASKAGRASAAPVYAGIYFNINGHSFPARNWSDFAVVVNSWWCEAALNLLSGKSQYEEFRFMEGPYLAEVFAIGKRDWRVRCVEERTSRRVTQCQQDIDSRLFVESLLNSAEALLALCRERNWWDSDAENLKSNATSLRQYIGDWRK